MENRAFVLFLGGRGQNGMGYRRQTIDFVSSCFSTTSFIMFRPLVIEVNTKWFILELPGQCDAEIETTVTAELDLKHGLN